MQRKSKAPDFEPEHPKAASDLLMWLKRAERIRTQQRHDENKLYALHAPEVECIGKGKARKPFEFGVKSVVVISHKHGLMLGARTVSVRRTRLENGDGVGDDGVHQGYKWTPWNTPSASVGDATMTS